MRFPRKRGSQSVMVRVFIPDNSVTTGAGIGNLTSASTNLVIAYMRELDGTATTYTGANIEAQTTIGTYQAPSSSSKIRFKAVDATNFPGLYELQFHNSATAFGTGDASRHIVINILETSTTALKIGPNMVLIPLSVYDVSEGETNAVAVDGAALTSHASGKFPADLLTVAGATQTATDLAGDLVKGNVNDAGPTTTDFDGNSGLSSSDDFYNGSVLVFTSGTLKGIARKITDYTGSSRNIVFTAAFPTAPTNADTFEILGRID